MKRQEDLNNQTTCNKEKSENPWGKRVFHVTAYSQVCSFKLYSYHMHNFLQLVGTIIESLFCIHVMDCFMSNMQMYCQINAPGEQAVVFIDPLQRLPFTKSNKSWSCRRLLRSMQVKRRIKWSCLYIGGSVCQINHHVCFVF